jgi:hypothetical protein
MADLEIEFSDVLAWLHCPKASVHGYTPAFDAEAFWTSGKILRTFPSGDMTELERIVPDKQRAVRWLSHTELQMLRQNQTGRIEPPLAEEEGEWTELKNRYVGRYVTNVLGQEVALYINLPYLHAPQSTHEAVYIDPSSEPRTIEEKSSLNMLAAYQKEVFRAMTGETLYARYIAPAMEIERKLRQPAINLEGLIHLMAAAPVADPIRPGRHCEETVREGNSFRYRCPLREAGKCNPFDRPGDTMRPDSVTKHK